MYSSVIVITDRRVLDQQLQDTIYQFDHQQGVVVEIDENSTQLAEALTKGKLIIITTLQKFPWVLDKVSGLGDKRFALILDEAHSSQSGKAAVKLREVLTTDGKAVVAEAQFESSTTYEDAAAEEAELTDEDVLNRIVASRKRPTNVSYYASWKDRKALAAAIKPIYTALTAEAAQAELEAFEQGPWGSKFPTVGPAWRRAWDRVIPFFAFPPEVRRVTYTTNAIESVNARLRKIIKTRGHFPSDDAATKLIWLALRNITANWGRPANSWKVAMNQFAILYEDRFTQPAHGGGR